MFRPGGRPDDAAEPGQDERVAAAALPRHVQARDNVYIIGQRVLSTSLVDFPTQISTPRMAFMSPKW